MSGTKKLPKYVTYATLAQFAKAADATFAVRLNAMEERLRSETLDIASVPSGGAPVVVFVRPRRELSVEEEYHISRMNIPGVVSVVVPCDFDITVVADADLARYGLARIPAVGISTYEGNHLAPTNHEGDE